MYIFTLQFVQHKIGFRLGRYYHVGAQTFRMTPDFHCHSFMLLSLLSAVFQITFLLFLLEYPCYPSKDQEKMTTRTIGCKPFGIGDGGCHLPVCIAREDTHFPTPRVKKECVCAGWHKRNTYSCWLCFDWICVFVAYMPRDRLQQIALFLHFLSFLILLLAR